MFAESISDRPNKTDRDAVEETAVVTVHVFQAPLPTHYTMFMILNDLSERQATFASSGTR